MKLETAYFTAKEELPIAKLKKIRALEVKNGVQLGDVYANDTSACVMIDVIGDSTVYLCI